MFCGSRAAWSPVLVAVVAGLAAAPTTALARPTPGASYLVSYSDNILSVSADGTAFGDSAVAAFPPDEFGQDPPHPVESFFWVTSRCRVNTPAGNQSSTYYVLNGTAIRRDGSFDATIWDEPSASWTGPRTTEAVFRLHGRFTSKTRITGWFSERRYRRVKPAGSGAARRTLWCHTDRRTKHYRVTFTGRQRPIQWIVDHTGYAG